MSDSALSRALARIDELETKLALMQLATQSLDRACAEFALIADDSIAKVSALEAELTQSRAEALNAVGRVAKWLVEDAIVFRVKINASDWVSVLHYDAIKTVVDGELEKAQVNTPMPVARTEQAQESTDAFPRCDACQAPYGTHSAHCWRERVIR